MPWSKRLTISRRWAAHQAIQKARMRMGSDRIDWISLSPTVRFDVDVSVRTIMGLKIPSVEIDIQPSDTPPCGVSDTSAALDEAREKWMDVLRFLAGASDVFTSVWRLAMELRKTQRQVNAIESTLIPRYRNTIQHIESRLEEEGREEIFITAHRNPVIGGAGGRHCDQKNGIVFRRFSNGFSRITTDRDLTVY